MVGKRLNSNDWRVNALQQQHERVSQVLSSNEARIAEVQKCNSPNHQVSIMGLISTQHQSIAT